MSDLSKIKLNGTVYNFKDTAARSNHSRIYYGEVDGTSTSTAFTATIEGITEYSDGLIILLYNGVVTSAANFTININGLGALGSYNNMALGNPVTPTAATRDTTIFNINYAMMFIYSSDIGGSPAWICYRGYDANTNTLGYQIRTNSYSLPMKSIVYRYRLLFQSADHNGWVPANNSSSTNATAARTVCQDPIDPFGLIVYYGTTTSVAASSRPSTSYLWEQYTVNLGYSFQKSTNYSLTSWKPVYVKCTPQSDGSAIIDSTEPIVQDLPSTEDGKIYIFLGVAYSTTNIELIINHPVYFYKNGSIRLWSNAYETEVVYPVTSVNGDTGAITIDEIQTTAGENNVEYDLIGTAPANTNSGIVPLYKPTLLTFAKTTDYGRLTLGSSDTPGVLRIYSSTTNASGYTDLKTGSSSTNTRTITFPDATGTVALTSDIPSVSSWALAANKPSYTFSELTSHPTSIGGYGITDAYTKTEVDGMVSGVLHYKGTKATVSALPSSGNTNGDVWHVTADGSEWAWDGSDWQELGTAVDLSGYVPTSRTVNGKALSSDISLTASDVSALPSSTTYVSSFNGESGAITYTAPVTSVNGQTGAVTITDSDEKLKISSIGSSNSLYYPIISTTSTTAETKYYCGDFRFRYTTNETELQLGQVSNGSTKNGKLTLCSGPYYTYLKPPVYSDISGNKTYTLPTSSGTLALTSDIPTTASDVGALADDCAAAGITSTDISNWNAKLDSYTETDPTVPSWAKASSKPTYTASEVGAVRVSSSSGDQTSTITNNTGTITLTTDNDADPTNTIILSTSGVSLSSTGRGGNNNAITITSANTTIHNLVTPTADTDAATKKYVDDSVSGITHPVTSVNTKTGAVTLSASDVGAVPITGGTLTGTLTVNAAGANTNGKIVFQNNNADFGATTTLQQNTMIVQSEAMGYLLINGRAAINQTPTFDTAIVNKQYVDNKFSSISVPQPYNATTNPTGYLRITDLPIYDGTVV